MAGNDRELCLHFTDLHFGKITETGFGLRAARRYLEAVPDRLSKRPDARGPYDAIRVLFTGDLVEGTGIYPSQEAETGGRPMTRQMAVAGESIWAMLHGLYKVYGCPLVVDWVPGNHGRVSKSAHPQTNFDNLLCYNTAIRAYEAGLDWLSVRANYHPFQTVDVLGWRGLITHKAVEHVGTAWKQRKALSWMTHYNATWMASGHFHSPSLETIEGRYFVKGGSLCGPDSFSESHGWFEPAGQAFWTIDKKRGLEAFSVLRF